MFKWMNRISVKLGLLFSSLFFTLFFLLGFMLFQLFSHLFIDYITQDLSSRGENHAKVLENNFTETTMNHVALMEQEVITNVIVTDSKQNILISSDPVTPEMKSYLSLNDKNQENVVLNREWKAHQYIVTLSPIEKGIKGFVFMYYPTSLLRETVDVLRVFMVVASIGVVLIALGMIVLISNRMTIPLLKMRNATIQMAKGDYKQTIDLRGKDELNQLGESIQKLGEQLSYFEETRNDFLAGVSHELRTPLTYIQGYTDILVKGLIKEEQERRKYLKIIHEETKRVTHLLNDLFNLAQIQTGQFSLTKEWVSMIELLEKVVHNLTPVANKKGLYIKMEGFTIQNSRLLIDPVRMEQVLFNLIENAIKYTEKGGVLIEVDQDKENFIIKIKDTGIGVSKEELSRIWERFYRVEKSRSRQTGGTGIGLYLVRRLVSLHNGTIHATSKEGEGSEFILTLPKAEK